ncbi:MAG: hypothetical protein M3362_00835 [Acidobacteriota bacterium]|nr:hypothetical protein [Acidobacteriota bacterium]
MANNLFVSYDLYNPGQNYEKVAAAIKSLGNAIKVQLSLWYVKSNYNANQAIDVVGKAIDSNDTLIVVDATNKQAVMKNLKPEISKFIIDNWNK